MVIALLLVQVTNVIDSWMNSSVEIAQLAGQQVKSLLIARLEERAPAAAVSISEQEQVWSTQLQNDRRLTALLEDTMAQSSSIIEISIASMNGKVIASSNPLRPGTNFPRTPALNSLRTVNPVLRANRVLQHANDYDLQIPIGIRGEQTPLFTIQVLVSSVLLRGELLKRIQPVGEWGLAALAASVFLAFASSQLATRNLTRIGRVIDSISSGEEVQALGPGPAPSPEFAVIESKLNILGHQVRDAREDVSQLRSNVQKLLEGLEQAILLFDSEQRLILCGGAAGRILGLAGDAIAGRKVSEIFPPESPLGNIAQQALESHRPVAGRQVGGLLVTVEFIPDIRESGGLAALMRVQDAHGHQRLESQLGASLKMDAISRITSSVAHEIKNPLNAISARLDYLQAWAASNSPEAEEEIQTIFQEVNRLDRVVRNFLDFTRPVEVAQDDVDMVELAGEIAALLKPDALRRAVSVQFKPEIDRAVVRGDQDLIKEAILNIASNGMDAMPRGGELKIGVMKENRHCRVTISDTGIGIPESNREKIFQLYFSTKENGSGLGLPMAYRTVQLHGGTIGLQSEVGKGTTFSLNLPIIENGNFS